MTTTAEDLPALPLIVMGMNDQRHCLRGWYFREYDGRNGVCYRWTATEAVLQLSIPAGARFLRFMIAGASGLSGKPASFSLIVDDRRIAHFPKAASTDFWSVVEAPISRLAPPSGEREVFFTLRSEERVGSGRVEQFVPRVFIPDEYLHNGDPRTMGVMVAAIRVL